MGEANERLQWDKSAVTISIASPGVEDLYPPDIPVNYWGRAAADGSTVVLDPGFERGMESLSVHTFTERSAPEGLRALLYEVGLDESQWLERHRWDEKDQLSVIYMERYQPLDNALNDGSRGFQDVLENTGQEYGETGWGTYVGILCFKCAWHQFEYEDETDPDKQRAWEQKLEKFPPGTDIFYSGDGELIPGRTGVRAIPSVHRTDAVCLVCEVRSTGMFVEVTAIPDD